MFEIEDIYEFVDKEAFPSLDEFKTYANSGSAADIYEFVDKGAFATLDEFTSLLKKKDEPGDLPTKDEGEDTSSVSGTAPKVDGLSDVSALTEDKEVVDPEQIVDPVVEEKTEVEEAVTTPQYTEEKAEETKGDISSLRSRWENTMKSIRDLYTVEKEKIMSAEPETIEELGEK